MKKQSELKTQYLSAAEREKGKKSYLAFASFNGLGFSFLGDTPIYLLAIHFGASNTQIGYLSSGLQVSGLVLLFLPRLLAGKNIIKVQFLAWLLRGLICTLYGLLFFVTGQTAVALILSIYTLFCLLRTFGVAMDPPVQQMLTTPATTGELIVQASNRGQWSRLYALAISFGLLSIKQLAELTGLFVLQVLGICSNTLGALYLKQIPCREFVEYRRGRNLFVIFRESLKHRERAITMMVQWLTLSVAIMFGFVVPFLRRIVKFPNNTVFFFTIIGNFATILAGYFLKPFVDRIGSKPMLMMASFISAIVALTWSILPPTIPWGLLYGLSFVTSFFQTMIGLLVSRLALKSIPNKGKIGYTSMVNFFSAIISLFMGLCGGQLADFGGQTGFAGFNPFGLTFLAAALLALTNGILCSFLKDPGSLSVKETLHILFSTRNLKAFLDIYQLNITDDPLKRKSILMSIQQSETSLATEELQRIIKNPLSPEKGDALKSLFENPRPALLPDLLREALDAASYHRQSAVFALGAYPNNQSAKVLIGLLDDPSPAIRSTAAKSLALIGKTGYLKKIKRLAAEPNLDLWATMNYFIALSVMDERGEYLADLFARLADHKEASFKQAMFSLAAKMLECEPILAELYQEENLAPQAGLKTLLEDTKQLQPFLKDAALLAEHYAQGRYEEIWRWCRELLKEKKPKGPLFYLRQSINTHDLRKVDQENTFAAIYFTYQILK